MKKNIIIALLITLGSLIYAETVTKQLENGKQVNAEKTETIYKYDSNGNVIYIKDKNGETWNEYDKNGKLIHFQLSNSRVKHWFNLQYNLNSTEEFIEYDSKGNVKSVYAKENADYKGGGYYTAYYNKKGLKLYDIGYDYVQIHDSYVVELLKWYEEETKVKYYSPIQFDDNGYLKNCEYHLDWFFDYDTDGNLLHYYDKNSDGKVNREIWYTYDSNKDLIYWKQKYQSWGEWYEEETRYNYTYNSKGNLIEKRRDGFIVEKYKYDTKGNLLFEYNNGRTTINEYNEKNKLIKTMNSSGEVIEYEYKYNKNGQVIRRIELSYRM